jgi:hypothetical protein
MVPPPKKKIMNETLRVKNNNHIAIALGSLSIFRQVTRKGKSCSNRQILRHKVGKIHRNRYVALNQFSFKSILSEGCDLNEII